MSGARKNRPARFGGGFEELNQRLLLAITSPILEIEGPTEADVGSTLRPPDTIGDVGPYHYILAVNGAQGPYFRIYDKTGVEQTGLKRISELFDEGTNCHDRNDAADPTVNYDHFEDRWILSYFTVTPKSFCLAASKSGTPTGNANDWYTHETAVTPFDYQKIGVWENAYFMADGSPSGQ